MSRNVSVRPRRTWRNIRVSFHCCANFHPQRRSDYNVTMSASVSAGGCRATRELCRRQFAFQSSYHLVFFFHLRRLFTLRPVSNSWVCAAPRNASSTSLVSGFRGGDTGSRLHFRWLSTTADLLRSTAEIKSLSPTVHHRRRLHYISSVDWPHSLASPACRPSSRNESN